MDALLPLLVLGAVLVTAPGPRGPAPTATLEGEAAGQREPLDAGLEDEATILREAESDPRNFHRDAFPVVRSPRYVGGADAEGMDPGEWVIGVEIEGRALAFPINVLNQHEIVVDATGDVPFMVCWCPLCRTGMVYDRRLDGEVLDFGHSGKLYRNAFLLYEVGTDALWHHATGQALTGDRRGRLLQAIPCHFVKWAVWRETHPDTEVLAKDPDNPDHMRDSYEEMNMGLELTYGLGVVVRGIPRLYEFKELEKTPLVQETVGEVPIVVYRDAATETTVAWDRRLNGEVLDLRAGDGATAAPRLREVGPAGSVFDAVTGECVEGPRRGQSLRPIVSSFWEVYAWSINHPTARMYKAPPEGSR
jgi:hypothetical protein